MAAPNASGNEESQTKKKGRYKKDDDEPVRVINNPVDLQRLKLEKLMNNPAKPVNIPEKSKEKAPGAPLEFIRNIWGSSAGAGSGDFHVYRGVRRREYARQKYISEKAEKDELDDAYKKKLEQNKKEAEERTAKNRAKRLKKKQRMKANKKKKGNDGSVKQSSQESSDEADERSDACEDDRDEIESSHITDSQDGNEAKDRDS